MSDPYFTPPITVADPPAESPVTLPDPNNMADFVKARRTWRVTKASLQTERDDVRTLAEKLATERDCAHTRADHWKQKANLWRRLALASCSAFLVLAAWGWPW